MVNPFWFGRTALCSVGLQLWDLTTCTLRGHELISGNLKKGATATALSYHMYLSVNDLFNALLQAAATFACMESYGIHQMWGASWLV